MAKKKTPDKTEVTSKPSAGFDTDLAASAAARMLAARARGALPATGGTGTSAFKQLKQAADKPHSAALDSAINSSDTSSNVTQRHEHGKQTQQKNQTFNADVNRAGVPRRTGG